MSTPPAAGPVVPSRRRLVRAGWFAGGWSAVAVGSVGVVVPGLPTTVFFILAAGCFGRCSPRFERWVLELPRVGPLVRDHRDGLGMPRRAKCLALASMWVAIALSTALGRDRLPLVALLVALGLAGTAHIVWRVPQREAVLARRDGPAGEVRAGGAAG